MVDSSLVDILSSVAGFLFSSMMLMMYLLAGLIFFLVRRMRS